MRRGFLVEYILHHIFPIFLIPLRRTTTSLPLVLLASEDTRPAAMRALQLVSVLKTHSEVEQFRTRHDPRRGYDISATHHILPLHASHPPRAYHPIHNLTPSV